MSIKTKLSYVFIVVFSLVMIMAMTSYLGLKNAYLKLNYDIPQSISTLEENLRISNGLSSIRYYDELLFSSLSNYLYTQNPQWFRKYYANEHHLENFEEDIQADNLHISFAKSLIAQSHKLREQEQEIINLAKLGKWQEAQSLFQSERYSQGRKILEQEIFNYMDSLGDNPNAIGHSSILAISLVTKEAKPILKKNLQANIAILIVLLIVIVVLTVLTERQIIKPLEAFVKVADGLAKGERKFDLQVVSKDEIGKLASAFYNLTRELESTTVSRDTLATEVEKRKIIETKLRKQSYDLECSNRDLEQFAYIASHDLQEPLRTVSNYLGLIVHKFHKNTMSDEEKEYTQYILDAIKRMKDLITDVLEFSRIGKSEDRQQVDLQELLQLLLQNLKPTIEELDAEINCSNMPKIMANKNEIYQLFQNLIGNALKFKGGKKPIIEISSVEENDFWKFSVKDNGIGIQEEYAEKIFLIFQRLHDKNEYEGTGIGLAVCKKIVEKYGGKIWVESKSGEGSCFYFTVLKNFDAQPAVSNIG